MRYILSLLALLYVSIAAAQRPILPEFHADPSAHYWDGKYWIYPSTDEAGSESWLEMKRWHCYSSTDLSEWRCEGEIFGLDKISWASQAAFAPDAVKWGDKYYFFFPAQFNIGVAVSDKPNGPFEDALGRPLIENEEAYDILAFDPCIFIDDDNTPYLYYGGGYKCGVVELSDDLLSKRGSIKRLDLPGYGEGIWVHKRGDTYYFSYPMEVERKGQTKQLLAYCTAPTPYGPFTYHGVFLDNDSRNSHHSIIEIEGQWYIFYHIQGPSPYERLVCVEYLEYDKNGNIMPVMMSDEGVEPLK